MTALKRIGLVVGVAIVAVGVYAAWYVYGAWPVPGGYEFPRHSMWGGGPLGLYEGTLVERDGCIGTDSGFTVVWPPGYRLTIEDGQPVVRGSGRDLPMGEYVSLGGGWYENGLPEVASGAGDSRCPEPFFLTTGVAD